MLQLDVDSFEKVTEWFANGSFSLMVTIFI